MSTQDAAHTRSKNNERRKDVNFQKSPARRGVLRLTGVAMAVLLVAVGSAAFTFARRPEPVQVVAARPPARLQRAADQLVTDGVPGVIIMTRRGRQVWNEVAGLGDKATGQPMRPARHLVPADEQADPRAVRARLLRQPGRYQRGQPVQRVDRRGDDLHRR